MEDSLAAVPYQANYPSITPGLAFRNDFNPVSEAVQAESIALPAREYLITNHKVEAGLHWRDCGGQKQDSVSRHLSKSDQTSSSSGKKKPCTHHLEQFPSHTVVRPLAGTGDERLSCHFESRREMPAQSYRPRGIRLGWALTLRWSSSAILEDVLEQRRDAGKHFSFALPC